jgi:hypothetical protein
MYAATLPDDGPWPLRFDVLGFSYWNVTLPASRKNGQVHAVGFTVPHALLALLLAIPPAIAARRYVTARRTTNGVASGFNDYRIESKACRRAATDRRRRNPALCGRSPVDHCHD